MANKLFELQEVLENALNKLIDKEALGIEDEIALKPIGYKEEFGNDYYVFSLNYIIDYDNIDEELEELLDIFDKYDIQIKYIEYRKAKATIKVISNPYEDEKYDLEEVDEFLETEETYTYLLVPRKLIENDEEFKRFIKELKMFLAFS